MPNIYNDDPDLLPPITKAASLAFGRPRNNRPPTIAASTTGLGGLLDAIHTLELNAIALQDRIAALEDPE